ncbi:MAG: S1-like domain-containing RNA-binding protein [Bernardetiaceae bacterium]|jgi:hypothetical protein|nr:S1-like domain-containing RNA-binding protein [Bernardetiaceae bacterium]
MERADEELRLGRYNRLRVVKFVDFGLYLDSDQGEILLPRKYVPPGTQVDDVLEVFIYTDSEDRPIATTLKPLATEGQFASLRVKNVATVGAFLDWGLEKDLFVPFKEQLRRMEEGRRYVVRVCVDHQSGRLVGTSKIAEFLYAGAPDLEEGQPVDLMVFDQSQLGFSCIVNGLYRGMLFRNEVFRDLEVGDVLPGFVKQLRPDHRIDLTLQKSGMMAMRREEEKILTKLRANRGFVPFGDKSEPEAIYREFAMSKKTFKAALGQLYKQRRVRLAPEGTYLLDDFD